MSHIERSIFNTDIDDEVATMLTDPDALAAFNSFIEDPVAQVQIVPMSPDDYLKFAGQMKGEPRFAQIRNMIKQQADNPEKTFVRPSLNYINPDKFKQDGRHRTLLARELGYTHVPVIVAYRDPDNMPDELRMMM